MLMALAADACAQPTYPSKAIRLIVPSTAGANRDLSARLLGQKFAEAWGQNVIVDNRPGGNTLVGFAEAGVPGFNVKNWNGVVAPVGTPKPVIDKLAGEIARILTLPDLKEKLASLGGESFATTPAQFTELMKTDQARYAKILAHITLDR